MNTRTEHLIESWFAHSLSEAEAAELRQILANDPEAAAEFAWQQSLSHAVRNASLETEAIRVKLREAERRFRFRRIMLQLTALAAVILALLVAVWFINRPDLPYGSDSPIAATQDTQENPGFIPQAPPPLRDSFPAENTKPQHPDEQDKQQAEKALQQQRDQQRKQRALRDSLRLDVIANFRHFNNKTEFNTAGGIDEEKEMAMNAFILYDQKDYAKAVKAFKPVVASAPGNMEYQFYYGVSLLGNREYEAAAKVFQQVSSQTGNYQTQAKFYLGLSNTGTGQYQAARQAFQAYLDAPNNRQFKVLAENMLQKLPQ
ncbi:MAG: hypothetical protein DYG98_12585 [Haliscomenobacteraceae bacterium CHB4]|nr:hypothetical protein [Haliscomenobacteraceae bacterium CHB4]